MGSPSNDPDPTNFDFGARDSSECGNGGRWIDEPIIVNVTDKLPDDVATIDAAANNDSWAWAFTKSFFGDFSLKPTGKAGKYGNCVENNRLDNALRSLGAAYGHPDVGNFLGDATLVGGRRGSSKCWCKCRIRCQCPSPFWRIRSLLDMDESSLGIGWKVAG
jgi:hypothetical protein